jgi:hypothetical protein
MNKCRVTTGTAGDIERDLNSFFERHPGIKIISTTQSTSNIQYPQTYCVVVIYEETDILD